MISNNTSTCQDCGGKLKYYDKVRRIVRTKGRVSKWVNVPRYQCSECGCIRRYLPDYIYPYKQYESEIIAGIISGWLPIGKATRNGQLVTKIEDMNSKYGRINFYISPKRLYEETGYVWKGEKR